MLKSERGGYKRMVSINTCSTYKNHMHRARMRSKFKFQHTPSSQAVHQETSIKSRKCTPSILQLSRKLLSIRWSMPKEALTSES